MITVYTATNCQPCRLTLRALQCRGLSVIERAAAAPENARQLRAMGCRQAPVVVLADGVSGWSGFRPDLIDQLADDGSWPASAGAAPQQPET